MEQNNEVNVPQEGSAAEVSGSERKTDTWGIVSFVMGIIGFFSGMGSIFFGTIGVFAGLKSEKSAFGIMGLALSGFQVLLFVLFIVGMGISTW